MADTTNRLAGTVYIDIDGQSYPTVDGVEYAPGLVEREMLVGADSVHGYSEKPVTAKIKATFRDTGGTSVAGFNAMTNVTITGQLANGKLIIARQMTQTGEISVNVMEATFAVTFEGPQGGVSEG